MSGSITLFTNESGTASGVNDYIRDVFDDVTLQPNTNSGFTDTASTNPFGFYFGNSDVPSYGIRTYTIKDITLLSDRSKWVNNKPTYQVIFNETVAGFFAYVWGNVQISYENGNFNTPLAGQMTLVLRDIGDGFGVTGILRRAAFLVNDDTSATATGQLVVDGSNTTTIDFSSLTSTSDVTPYVRSSVFVSGAANQTLDIHDFRVTALQSSTLRMVGLSLDQSGLSTNISLKAGVSYVDKTKVTTTTGATLAVPSLGSSLGGMVSIFKTQFNGYTAPISTAPLINSIATGSNGAAIINVSTGQGQSFLVGGGVVSTQGTSTYVGSIVSISTDALTVTPVLPFALSSAPIYQSWAAAATYAIGSSILNLKSVIDFSQFGNGNTNGSFLGQANFTGPILNLSENYAVFGNNLGITTINNNTGLYFLGASGFLQVEGRFSAARMETIGPAIFNATLSINGVPSWSVNEGQTGINTRTVMTNAGPGWNRFVIQPGTSMGTIGFQKIDLYEPSPYKGITFGLLGAFSVNQAYCDRSAINATLSILGLGQRIFSDQMLLKGTWTRQIDSTSAGGVNYQTSVNTSSVRWEWYGKNYAVIGTPGTSAVLTLDGVSVGVTFNAMQTVTTEGWHSLVYQHQAGTAIIQAFDFATSSYGMKWLGKQTKTDTPITVSQPITSEVLLVNGNGAGSSGVSIRRFSNSIVNGTAMSYVDSSTDGAAIIINESGLYALGYTDYSTSTGLDYGISRNASSLVTGILNLPLVSMNLVVTSTSGANVRNTVFCTVFLSKGDIIRPHGNGSFVNGATSAEVKFRATKLISTSS